MMSALTDEISSILAALTPIVEAVVPTSAVAISLGTKIVQGVIAAEPTAVALYDQIKSGTPVTDAQLAQYAAGYETAYQRLQTDIAARLQAMGQTAQ